MTARKDFTIHLILSGSDGTIGNSARITQRNCVDDSSIRHAIVTCPKIEFSSARSISESRGMIHHRVLRSWEKENVLVARHSNEGHQLEIYNDINELASVN